MKKTLIFIFFILATLSSFSQRFGNEWIVFGQQYIKLSVDTKGIYKIQKADLHPDFITVGKPLQNYQLFFRGIEMKINVIGNPTSDFGGNDYIEFYAMNNDGKQDESLYRPITARPNKYHSLYSDETAYFLTAGNNIGKRMSPAPANSVAQSDPFYLQTILNVPATDWNFDIAKSIVPGLIQSYYEPSEGMVSRIYWNNWRSPSTPYNADILLPNYNSTAGINVKFEALVVPRSIGPKNVTYNLGNGISGSVGINNFFSTSLINADIPTITADKIPLNMSISGSPAGAFDLWSYYYTLATFPSLPVFKDNIEYKLKTSSTGHITLSGAPAAVYGYDITDIFNQENLALVINGSNLDVTIESPSSTKSFWLTSNTKKPKAIKTITFNPIDRNLYDYLIVTDSRIITGATAFKTYRESTQGGTYKVLVEDKQNLFDQFGYGERNPIAIRRFCDYMTNTAAKMKYLFLIGKSISQTNMLRTHEAQDFVPTFGFPASDILFSSGFLGKTETESSIPTGRLVVTTDSEITGYLNKVMQHETRATSTWQKNLLHIVGPKSQSEYVSLFNTMEGIRNLAISSTFAANAANYPTINKTYNAALTTYPEIPVPADFYTKMNNGVGIVAYYGHGTSTSTGYNIGYVSTQIPTGVGGALYNNPGKYPVLLAFGCGISDSFFGEKDIASDWVNTPNKGAINAISMSYLSYEGYDTRNLESLYGTWFGTLPNAKMAYNLKSQAPMAMINAAIGDVAQQSSVNMVANYPGGDPNAPNPDLFFVANLQQTMLLGDPSIPVFKAPIVIQPLSLTLIDVKASNQNKKTIVSWKTENEVNFNGFEIERSSDSKSFKKIGFVKGNNNLEEKNNYYFDDESPEEGINYYRLKMIDLDGKSNYSKIVSIEFELPENNLTLFGNPSNNFQFQFKLNDYFDNSAKLFDVKGNNLNLKIQKIETSLYNVTVPTAIVKGSYIFKLDNNKGKNFSKKVIFE